MLLFYSRPQQQEHQQKFLTTMTAVFVQIDPTTIPNKATLKILAVLILV
jgi:hypothetical protein